MKSSKPREINIRIDRVVIDGKLPGMNGVQGLEAAVAVELRRLLAGEKTPNAVNATGESPALQTLARQIAVELHRKVGSAC